METPFSGLSVGSNMAAGNQWKPLEFTLALSKRFFCLKAFA